MPVSLDDVYETAEGLLELPSDVPTGITVTTVLGFTPSICAALRITVDILREAANRPQGAVGEAARCLLDLINREVAAVIGDELWKGEPRS